jgi:hypothetical protein
MTTRKPFRIAMLGASGTGKTTLAQMVSEHFGIEINPVGARSVSRSMGFDSPYDVDKAGKRAEFQRRLLEEKTAWEMDHLAQGFVTDRTPLDNLAYTMLHDVKAVDEKFLQNAYEGTGLYTHILYCPVDVFIDVANDPARVADLTYHRLFDATIHGLLRQVWLWVTRIDVSTISARSIVVKNVLGEP